MVSVHPANNNTITIRIKEHSSSKGRVQILNTFGTPLIEMNYDKSEDGDRLSCDVSKLRSGLYLVKFVDKKTGFVSIKNLIIE